jgi:hypothetical protein
MGTPKNRATLMTVPGSGLRCDGCRQPITSSQVECRAGGARFHQWCHYTRSTADREPSDPEWQIG